MAYRLALICLLLFAIVSCANTDSQYADLSQQEKEELAYAVAEAGYHYRQGSELRQMYLDSAIAIAPNLGQLYRSKAVWFVKNGRFKKHFELLEKAVSLDSTALNYKGKNHLLTRNYKAAVNDLLAYDKTTDNPDDYSNGVHLHLHVGLAQLAAGDNNEAIESLSKVINCEGKRGFDWVDHNAYLGKGIALKNLGNLNEAKGQLDTCILIYPNCSEAYYYLSLIEIENGNKNEALNFANKAEQSATYLQRDKFFGLTVKEIDELLDSLN